MSKSVILVPTDFTKVGECAVNHGIQLAKSANKELIILHVVKHHEDVEEARNQVIKIADAITQVTARGIVRVGNIFEDIGDAAAELNAKIIVMGTHGAKGMQKVMGSHALKVITSSEVPFIVVQQKEADHNGYDDIVVPVDLDKHTKQKLGLVVSMAKTFSSKIHLLFQKEEDAELKKTLKANIIFAKKYLEDHQVSYTTNIASSDEKLDQEIIRFSAKINADLIAIMNLHDTTVIDEIFGGNREQHLITNKEEIPVLIMNPKQISESTGLGYFS